MDGPERKQKSVLAGIPIGSKGDRLGSFLEELNRRGVFIQDTTLSRIRMGVIPGSVVTQQLLLDEVLKSGYPKQKIELFLNLADSAVDLRQYQRSHPQRYLSEGFTEIVAEHLSDATGFPFSGGSVRNCLRAMRADLLLYAEAAASEELIANFAQVAETYLIAYSSPPSEKCARHKMEINRHWDRRSVADFYRRIYAIGGPRTIGSWVPFEVGVLSQFYKLQSNGFWFTPLDKKILRRYRVREQNSVLVDSVRARIFTDFNQDALAAYANALAFGLPVNPLISESIVSTKASIS